MLEALKKRYEAQIAESIATLNIYVKSSVGIGEHPQHLDEMDKLLQVIVDAEEKIKVIESLVSTTSRKN